MSIPELRKELIKKVTCEVATKEHHAEMKNWQPNREIDIAHRYYYLNRTSYSGIKKTTWVPSVKVCLINGVSNRKAANKLEGVRLHNLFSIS
jgi:DNA adenine methylase